MNIDIPGLSTFIEDVIKSGNREGVSGLNPKEGSLSSDSDNGGRVETSNFSDVEGKKITYVFNKDKNELGVNLEEEGEFETNSNSCDDIDEIETNDIVELLGDSNLLLKV